jgi:predicted DNA-binding protein
MSTMSVRLPKSIHEQLRDLAKKEGVSINQLVNSAVAEKVAALLTEDYLAVRARDGSRAKIRDLLAKVPDVQPGEQDQLP